MTTAAAPVDETGGSPTSADPIDSLDLSTIGEGVELTSDTQIPDAMVVGGKREAAADDGTREDRGDGRTADGRFAKQPGEDAPPESQTPAPPTPFRYRSMGKTHDLEGATIEANGDLRIPAAKVADVQEAFNALQLAQGEYLPVIERHRQNNATLRARIQELEQAQGPKEAQADALMASLRSAFEEPDDEKALGMLFGLRRDYPLMLERARAAHFQKQLQARTQQPAHGPQDSAPTPQQAAMPTPDAAKATALETVEHWKLHPEFRGMPAEAWKAVEHAIQTRPYSFIRPATAEDAQKHPGVVVGIPVFDRDLLLTEVDLHRSAHAKQKETADAQARLAAANARRTQLSITAPPTPGGGRAPTAKSKTPTTKEELDRWFDSDEL